MQGSSEGGYDRRADSVEADDVDPYPYLEIYKDEDDREYIDDLPELEREEILASRRDEKSKRQQKRSLLAMYQTQQGHAPQRSESKKRKAPSKRRAADSFSDDETESEQEEPESDYEDAPKKRRMASAASKRDKLKQLSARAKAKKAGAAEESSEEEPMRRGYVSDSGSEFEYSRPRTERKRHGSVATSDDDEWDATTEPPPLEALNALKLDRQLVVNVMHRQGWEVFLRHKFIRFSWGPRLDNQGRPALDAQGRAEEVFRIHEVEGVTHGSDYYELAPGKATNVLIQIRLFGEKKTVDLRYVSNRPFTQSEVDRWAASVRGARGRFPSVAAMQRAEDRMAAYRDRAQTPEEIRTLLKNKKEALAAFKAQQEAKRKDTRAAPGPPPAPPASVLAQAQAQAQAQATKMTGRMDEKQMAEMNERNRKADRLRILEAEKRLAAAKRGGAGASMSQSQTPAHAAPRPLDVALPPASAGTGKSLLPAGLLGQLTAVAAKTRDAYAAALLSVDVDVGPV